MDRKFSIPVGMAMLAALALVGMLGIFAFNAAQPAQAAGIASATVTADPVTPGGTATYTFMVTTNSDLAAAVQDKFLITAPTTAYTIPGPAAPDNVTVNGMAAVTNVKANRYVIVLPADIASGDTATVVVPGVTNPATAGDYEWMVDSSLGDPAAEPATVTIGEVDPGNGGGGGGNMPGVSSASVTARPEEPGVGAQITVKFALEEGLDVDQTITLEVDDTLGVPSSINAADVSITGVTADNVKTASPRSVVVEENRPQERYRIVLFIANMDDSADATLDLGLEPGDVTITFRQAAGITNRTEGGGDEWYVKTTEETSLAQITNVYDVPWLIELSDYKGSRGDEITAIGRGFKNGTTTHFWRDANDDRQIDTHEDTLCSATANGDDIATCTFTLANPPFNGGTSNNYINAIDGRNKTVLEKDEAEYRPQIDLEPSMTITPQAGGPGDSINVQLLDLVEGDNVSRIELSRRDWLCDDVFTSEPPDGDGTRDADGNYIRYPCNAFIEGTTNLAGNNGTLSFSFEIPNRDIQGGPITPGIQDLRVFVDPMGPEENLNKTKQDDKTVNLNLGVASGELQLSSFDVLPNQRVSISGSGFTRSSNNVDELAAFIGTPPSDVRHGCSDAYYGSVTLGGEDIDWRRINDHEGIEVTSGGTWSAPIDLPVSPSTTVAGTRELKIVDCRGGVATVDLTFAEREVTITPEAGGVGSEVIITGKNFPVENDSSRSDVEVTVEYDAGEDDDDDDVDPDAIGGFTIILEVPENAIIPSNNTVKVSFKDDGDSTVLETFTHRIPQGTVSFSSESGAENSLLTIEANGFARYTSVDHVLYGDRDVTPIPKPSTDTNGNGTFEIRIPGSDPGIYIIRVQIAEVVATHTFTVVEGGGVEDGEVETILSNFISEGALDRIFRFDNATKTWSWYIADPAFSASNNLSGLSSGDLVFVKVTQDITADILGRSIDLTCINEGTAAEDCWNTITIP